MNREEDISTQEDPLAQEKDPAAQEEFLDFEVEIGPGSGRVYPVAVVRSVAGEAREATQLPFDDLALANQLLTLQNALLRSGGKSRHLLLPEEQSVQDFGRTLFTTLFTGAIGHLYAVSQREAALQGKGLRLKLRILAPEMAALPWEFLYDPSRAEYICLSRNTPVVRYLELPQPPQPLPVTLPLRILGMIATPSNLPPLDVQREQQRMEQALAPLQQRGLVQLTWLSGQTWREVQQAMWEGPWHIFHFIGHGSFDSLAGEGLVAFADENGQADLFRATQLGRLLADHRPLRLVVLNSCEGAKGGQHDIFSSTAAILVRHGIPAVLAMQYAITDAAAMVFSRAFYEALSHGMPIDAAVSEARKAVSFAVENTLEWGVPVLFMRSPDGVLFTVSQGPVSAQPSLPVIPLQQAPVMTPPSPPPPLVGINRIGVALNPETLTITPGQPAPVQVTLTNLGNTVDWFTTTVEGVASQWVQGPGEPTQVNPGTHETVALSVNVARTATNRAQDYPVTIRARSHEKPNESRTVHGTWTVLPFKEDTLGLEPRRASGRGSAAYMVILQNGGNAPDQYELSGEDDEQKLVYRFGQNPVDLDAGREAKVPLEVSTNRQWMGREKRQPFQVHARPAGSSSPLAAPGEFVNKVLIPTWLLAVVLVVVATIIVLIGVLPPPARPPMPILSPTSQSGIEWTAQNSGTSQDLNGVTWSGPQYVAVGGAGTILTSSNGSSWTTQVSGTSQSLLGVTWSGSQYVAVGGAGTILTSSNGSSWTTQHSGISHFLRGVTWSGSQYVAVTDAGMILTSSNGSSWTTQYSGTSQNLYGVTWSGSQYVAVGGTGTILTSP